MANCLTPVRPSLYPWEALKQCMRELNLIDVTSDTLNQEILTSQTTPKEQSRNELFNQAQPCVIEMNRFCHQKKSGGATDIAEVKFIVPQPSQCCFMAPYGSTCLGTMCKMKSMNMQNQTTVTQFLLKANHSSHMMHHPSHCPTLKLQFLAWISRKEREKKEKSKR